MVEPQFLYSFSTILRMLVLRMLVKYYVEYML